MVHDTPSGRGGPSEEAPGLVRPGPLSEPTRARSGQPSPAARAFQRDLERVAGSDAPVLVEGESGSGKNRTARTLHALSGRRKGPLVEVDLSALAPTLIEAELFGHEEGAFTGASHARVGRFVRANGGTLVLDGIERLPESMQGKLLRALQEKVVEPLGAERAVPYDARVIATSGADLLARVHARRFREDLYYRVAVVRLVVPALRERASEIEGLARELIVQTAERTRTPARGLSSAAIERLRAHPWPGNVRELENALERVLVMAGGSGDIEAAELVFLADSTSGVPERIAREALAHGIDLSGLEKALMSVALQETRGNVAAAARAVGLTRRAFELRRARHARGETNDANGADDQSGSDLSAHDDDEAEGESTA